MPFSAAAPAQLERGSGSTTDPVERVVPVVRIMCGTMRKRVPRAIVLAKLSASLVANVRSRYIFVFASPASPRTDNRAFWIGWSWAWSRA